MVELKAPTKQERLHPDKALAPRKKKFQKRFKYALSKSKKQILMNGKVVVFLSGFGIFNLSHNETQI